MTTLDASIKKYKQGLKDSEYTLKELETEARQYEAMEDNLHDAETAYETASAELESLAFDKERVREELYEATLTGGDVGELRAEYEELTNRENTLRDVMGDATKAVEENTPDPGEVASLMAALHRFGVSGGDELVRAVKTLVQEHSDALAARSEAAQELLPPVDSLTLLGELGRYSASHKSLHEGHRQAIEHEERISPAAGQKAVERLDYAVERILTRG